MCVRPPVHSLSGPCAWECLEFDWVVGTLPPAVQLFHKVSQDTYNLNDSYSPPLPMFYLLEQDHNVFMLFIGTGD